MYNVDKLVLNYIKEKKGMSKYDDVVPTSSGSGNYEFDQGLRWLSKNVNTILDFGCGNGTVLFWCSSYGTKKHIGIDLSEKAILNAKRRSLHMKNGEFQFICGEIDELKHINTGSVEAVILSNIVDNLYPEDAEKLLIEENDIIICARNGSKRLVGKSALIRNLTEPMTFGAFMAICKTPIYEYMFAYLQSDLFFGQLRDVSNTTTINQLTQNKFDDFLIPIPPVKEQERIAFKISQLFQELR